MFGWRSKALTALIVYFAGFATAIYTLAPAQDCPDRGALTINLAGGEGGDWNAKTQQFAVVAKAGIGNFLRIAEEKAIAAGKIIQAQMAQQRKNTEK
ncbi:MAG: hypothetical protein JW828_08605 [Sedimentisphaerales bacterium]|nr:hypothetical protein [Sedimentisphaerales bacterium]